MQKAQTSAEQERQELENKIVFLQSDAEKARMEYADLMQKAQTSAEQERQELVSKIAFLQSDTEKMRSEYQMLLQKARDEIEVHLNSIDDLENSRQGLQADIQKLKDEYSSKCLMLQAKKKELQLIYDSKGWKLSKKLGLIPHELK